MLSSSLASAEFLLQLLHREVEYRGTAVGTSAGRLGLLELSDELLHLLLGESLSSLDRGTFAHGGNESLFGLCCKRIIALPQHFQNVHQGSVNIRHGQNSWHCTEEVAFAAEGFQVKTDLVKPV
jgi:hypothetical protein